MKNSKTLFQDVVAGIHLDEPPEEIRGIVYLLFQSLFGLSKTDITAGKIVSFSEDAAQTLQKMMYRLNKGEPVQYVLGEEYFYGRRFHVNPSVLIPRPETEELVRVVVDFKHNLLLQNKRRPLKMLDIGTGSGCIPITLFHEAGPAEIYATDISTAALAVAVGNADDLGAKITFVEHDILNEKIPISGFDVIVSNPPYVTETEKREMRSNVRDFEPRDALFVTDDDPLIFYRKITAQAKDILKPGGLLAVEINEKFGKDVSQLFLRNGFKEVQIVEDVSAKQRVVKGYK